ncbi:MAG: DUF4982 domain-containing protein [Acidobacteria bacterium]|nr:DUF4982 domain-containing protein [Acidobacteriota bacterium]
MKKLLPLLFLACLSFSTAPVQVPANVQNINDGWLFFKGDPPGAEAPAYDASGWRRVDLPHDWSVEGPYSPALASATGYLPGGIGWYRRTIDIPVGRKGQKVFLHFEGIYRNGEIFVNGSSLGMRPSGYVPVQHDITPFVTPGGVNTVAVRVDHSESADSRWYTGSGIYRDVWLRFADPVHIAPWGIYTTTRAFGGERSAVTVETTLENSTGRARTVTVIQELTRHDRTVAARHSSSVTLPAGGSERLVQELSIAGPRLWSVEDPYLYSLQTTVKAGERVADRGVTRVGVRTLAFDPDRGFSLNGKNMKIKGVCLHHDAGTLGSAVPREVWAHRLETLKALGCNAIRTSHNPHAPLLYDLCDEMGLLVMDEAFDEWEFPKKKWLEGWNVGTPGFEGPASFFDEWGERDLGDLVLRDRNHPSVFMWSIGNEVDYPNDPYSHPILDREGIGQQHAPGYKPTQPHADRLGAIARRLAAVVRKWDPSRPVTAGLAGPVMSNATEYPAALDVAGYNYSENRYAADHARYPERVLYGSETGHSLDAWKAVRDQAFIFGQFLWTGIDCLGEAHRWPSRGFTSGLLDLAGNKKPRAFFRESLWSDKPMIYCGTFPKAARFSATDAPPVWNYREGDEVTVICYTNCEKARLFLDGRELGPEKARDDDKGYLSWDVQWRPGKLESVGSSAGRERARHTLETTGRPHAVRAVPLNSPVAATRGTALVEIRIVDDGGRTVLDADGEITCVPSGPVRLLGLEASDPTDMGDYTDNRQKAFQGKITACLQATGTKGTAGVRFTSPGLEPVEITLELK